MEITTDVYLRGPVWEDTIDKLKGTLFDTAWQIYALCISIGISDDQQLSFDPDDDQRYIPRNVLSHAEHIALLDFMFQSAILTTTTVALDEKTRLELAFGDEIKSNFKRLDFLTKFANYGVTVLHDQISDTSSDLEMMSNITLFLEEKYQSEGHLATEEDLLL